MTRLFGTDGVRGVANIELTPELAFKLGLYGGEIFRKKNNKPVLMGRDTRLSGDMLKSALAAGFMAAGLDVVDLGIVSTPLVAYLVKENHFSGGAVISASHNPYEYNGIKLFDEKGFKLTDDEEDEIEKMIKDDYQIERKSKEEIGVLKSGEELVRQYEDYLISLSPEGLKGFKIAIDCGNGALYKIAPKVLEEMGAEVVSIYTKPDGKNINKDCGSTNPKLVSQLVKETNADFGFSFDGDADRIIAVDEKGEEINGDHMLGIFAMDLKEQGKLKNDTVVGTVMTNMGLDVYLDSIESKVIKAPVGDRYVLESMVKGDYLIGGEQSGHIIFLEHNTTGDGLATGIHLANAIKKSGKVPSELNKLVSDYPQVLINATVENSKKYSYMENEKIKSEIEKIEEEFGKTGRVVIRPSGTEPLVRVMIEGKDQEEITKVAKDLADLIEAELK